MKANELSPEDRKVFEESKDPVEAAYINGLRDGEENTIEEAKLLRKTSTWVDAGDVIDTFIHGVHIQVLLRWAAQRGTLVETAYLRRLYEDKYGGKPKGDGHEGQ